MTQVQIRRVSQDEEAIRPVLDEMQRISDEVRRRAFSLFQERGCEHGRDLDDWLEAEGQLVLAAPFELVEEDDHFRLHVALAGLEGNGVEVIAWPDSIVVHGQTALPTGRGEGDGAAESAERKLLRRVCLPAEIDPDQVTATLEEEMLQIVAHKANRSNEGKIGASA